METNQIADQIHKILQGTNNELDNILLQFPEYFLYMNLMCRMLILSSINQHSEKLSLYLSGSELLDVCDLMSQIYNAQILLLA